MHFPQITWRFVLVVLALGWPAAVGQSQESSALATGSRVRVTTLGPPAHSEIGTYRGLRDSTLLLRGSLAARPIPLNSILRLELSRGRKPSTPGGIIGLVLGAGTGEFLLG